MLAETEDGVADGVVELEKVSYHLLEDRDGHSKSDRNHPQAVELLQGFPTEEMMTWVEDVSSTIPGIREQ